MSGFDLISVTSAVAGLVLGGVISFTAGKSIGTSVLFIGTGAITGWIFGVIFVYLMIFFQKEPPEAKKSNDNHEANRTS